MQDRLAAEYVLGTMPMRARRRFERLMRSEPDLRQRVAEWQERLAPLDATAIPETPPAHVWRAIEHRLFAAVSGAMREGAGWRGLLNGLAFWRGLALATAVGFAAAVLYIGIALHRPPPSVVAVLTDKAGDSFWVALRGDDKVRFSAVNALPSEPGHAFELWGIAPGQAPRALGLLPREPAGAFVIGSAELPPTGGLLAVSLEPPNGSPTGQPTGPVLWQGKTVAPAR